MGQDEITIEFQISPDSSIEETVSVDDIKIGDNWVIVETEVDSAFGIASLDTKTGDVKSTETEGEDHGDSIIYRIPRERIFYLSQQFEKEESKDSSDTDRSDIYTL